MSFFLSLSLHRDRSLKGQSDVRLKGNPVGSGRGSRARWLGRFNAAPTPTPFDRHPKTIVGNKDDSTNMHVQSNTDVFRLL